MVWGGVADFFEIRGLVGSNHNIVNQPGFAHAGSAKDGDFFVRCGGSNQVMWTPNFYIVWSEAGAF